MTMLKGEFYRTLHSRSACMTILVFLFVCLLQLGTVFLPENRERHFEEYQNRYVETLNTRLETLRGQAGSILFAERTEEIEKEIAVIEVLLAEDPVFQDDHVIRTVLQSTNWFPFAYVLAGMVLVYTVVYEDHDNHMENMYRAAKTSEKKLAFAKLAVIAMTLCAFLLVQTGTALLAMVLAGCDLSAHIQTVTGYMQFNITWNILQYDLYLNVFKWLTVMVLVWLFVVLMEKSRNIGLTVIVFLIVMIVEYLADLFLSLSSPLAFLKSWNVYHILTYDHPAAAIGMPYVQLGAVAVISVLCFLLALSCYNKQTKLSFHKNEMKVRKYRLADLYWLREMLVTKKGILIMLAVMIYCCSDALRYEAVKTTQAKRYEFYAERYYGRIDNALLERVQNDISAMQEAQARAMELEGKEGLSEAEEEEMFSCYALMEGLPYLTQIQTEIMNAEEAGADVFCDHTGMELLVNKNGSLSGYVRWLLVFLPVCIWLITVLSPVYQTGLWKMYYAARKGKRKFLKSHLVYFGVFGMLMYLIVFGFHAWKIFNHYDIGSLNQNLRSAMGIASPLPLYVFLILQAFLVFAVIVLFETAALYLSQRMNVIHASGCLILLVLTAVVMPYGISSLWKYDWPVHPVRTLTVVITVIAAACVLQKKMLES